MFKDKDKETFLNIKTFNLERHKAERHTTSKLNCCLLAVDVEAFLPVAASCEETGVPLVTVTSIYRDDDKCSLVSKLVQSILWLQGMIITEKNSNYMHRKHGRLRSHHMHDRWRATYK